MATCSRKPCHCNLQVNITDPENDPKAFPSFRHILLEDWPMQEIRIEQESWYIVKNSIEVLQLRQSETRFPETQQEETTFGRDFSTQGLRDSSRIWKACFRGRGTIHTYSMEHKSLTTKWFTIDESSRKAWQVTRYCSFYWQQQQDDECILF
jgi:hypothetical protein